MGVIKGICISEKRGTAKHEIEEAVLVKDWGIQGDAHAGHWHRQVSLLSYEKIEEFRKKGADIGLGAFGENLSSAVMISASSGRNPFSMRRCHPGDDANRERVSQPLRNL